MTGREGHPESLLPSCGPRRILLSWVGLVALAFIVGAHTPYNQWTVYRQKHLLILTHKTEPATYALGKRVAALLVEHLPSSRARVTRAPDEQRVASLLSTHQLEVAILSRAQATALTQGKPPFAAFEAVPLRLLATLGEHVLVSLSDFPDRHAYQVAAAILEHGANLVADSSQYPPPASVPLHPGTLAYVDGAPVPEEGD
jgi:TRAP-type uncharacterized transport system substrate-binding protein